jgi:hypothetical protein
VVARGHFAPGNRLGANRLGARAAAAPPASGVSFYRARNFARLQLAFRRFVGVFARPEHSLTLFLDESQWLDAATLDKAAEMKVSFCAARLKGWA